jgi:ribonuclease HI
VKGFVNARFKGFYAKSDAEKFIQENSTPSSNYKTEQEPEKPASKRRKLLQSAPPASEQEVHVSSKTARKENNLHFTPIDTTDIKQKASKSAGSSSKLQPTSPRKLSIHVSFDGGARGNPGVAGAGAEVIICYLSKKSTEPPERKKVHIREFVGMHATNNQAEYQGVLSGMRQTLIEVNDFIQRYDLTRESCAVTIVVQGDSDLIIKQLKGIYNCNHKNLKPYHKQVKNIISDLDKIVTMQLTLEHIYRRDNGVADGKLFVGAMLRSS